MKLTATSEVELSKVLSHQLNGIMLHFDLAMAYKMMGCKKKSRYHYKQAIEETIAHNDTNCIIIEHFHKIIKPAQEPRQRIELNVTYGMAQLEKDTAHEKAVQAWLAWEEDTADMYEHLSEQMPDCKLWCRLKRASEKEIKHIEDMM